MRKYQIIIDNPDNGKVLFNFGSFNVNDPTKLNPEAPNIQFNIQQFQAKLTTNNSITLFNIHPYYFSMNQFLYGMRVRLYAGMEITPMTAKLKYGGTYGMITDGYITAAIPEWNGKDTQLTIIIQPYNPSKKKPYVFDVKIGDAMVPKIIEAYSAIAGTIINFDTGNESFVSTTEYDAIVRSMSDIDKLITEQHEYNLMQTQSGYKLSPAASLTNITISSTSQIIALQEGDFIFQPSLVNLAEVAITLMMRSDIRIGDVVTIPQDIWVGLSALDVVRNADSLIEMFKGKTLFSMFSGSFKINKVWQIGDARNIDPQAWVTIVNGIKDVDSTTPISGGFAGNIA